MGQHYSWLAVTSGSEDHPVAEPLLGQPGEYCSQGTFGQQEVLMCQRCMMYGYHPASLYVLDVS